ncbi:tryptophan-rich sensory protein [Sinomonas susongensis]|uniref:tryptophan-rich sensory protein n=1 Tax=Sinomonas susongensis TaxID=1324851 RepID=UPI001108B3FD|nr:tryptophan-rich sensory protein [Sinomonas susongensis]
MKGQETRKRSALPAAALTAASAVIALVLAAAGSGAFGGTPVNSAAGGYFSSTATPVAPGAPAFSIWSLIYAGLLAYSVWQLLPNARASARQASLRPWAAASMLLNAAWLWVVQLGSVPGSLGVMAALLAVLCRIFQLSRAHAPGSRTEAVLSDGTFGLYLGWICVAMIANVAAVLAWAGLALPAEPTSVVVLCAAALVGISLAFRRTWAPLLSIAWGLAWIAVARANGPLVLPATALTAGTAAAAVLAAGVLIAGLHMGSGLRHGTARAGRMEQA